MATLEVGQHYQAIPVRWELTESNTTAAMGIRFSFVVTHYTSTSGEWVAFDPPQPQIEGTQWIMDRHGEARHNLVENLKLALGWLGANTEGFSQLTGDAAWTPTPCEIVVGEEEYKDKKRLRADWINPLNAAAGARQITDHNKARLRGKFLNAMCRPPQTAKPQPETPLSGDNIPF